MTAMIRLHSGFRDTEFKNTELRNTDNTRALSELRNEIFVKRTDGWYFNTREGMAFGPYQTFSQVSTARELFVLNVSSHTSDHQSSDLLSVETIELIA